MAEYKSEPQTDLIYTLEDTPGVTESTFAAIQHVLASFVGIITPTLVIGGVLGLGSHIPYLISMALIVSGAATFIQARRMLGVGAGMLCVQGTSFAFLSSILAAGFIAKAKGGGPDEILSLIFTVCFFGAFIEIFLSQIIGKLKNVVTPLVTGIVITVIGLSLIKVGMTDLAGGFKAKDLGSIENMMLGITVLLVVIVMNQMKNQWLRISSIAIGLVVGFIIAIMMGKIDFSNLAALPVVSIPVPFKFGFSFDLAAFLPIALIYIITAIETTGDITANCVISGQEIDGKKYRDRVKGGVLADGVNSLIAATFNTFPNTTFSQNNGVIQLTGVASRHVAYFIAVILIILGFFPIIGGVLQNMPKPVLGGATLIMFATVAAAGVKILKQVELNRRNMLVIAVSFGLGLGVMMVPEAIAQLPKVAQNIFGSAVTMGGLSAIILNLILPQPESKSLSVPELEKETKEQLATN
ncbi:nucleobase:cation symporter-2 family protein [Cocleimonas sp. KMM 6892]|uniref:uracil-xanthine permease family protein n=1 Tax=unclassified Cocleimonas TaxID=2639732 RepID=UPI002DB60650|nr:MULTISPECIES: nucleobase:cation symporter-2 family protein [unclassified Cocleimonas]MEB8431725.1 nucleobase:cation symporter-2 family protein [Cocleimonas sp. KMM 6892]MEC4715189.1 nucleobase:cation symporter-2 family protein [Cocleimonas sp. KMM 6895]MEC4743997.1 nucleobase:cation symporter-2 family protein [Cocleimonas sp. KMM 6896]